MKKYLLVACGLWLVACGLWLVPKVWAETKVLPNGAELNIEKIPISKAVRDFFGVKNIVVKTSMSNKPKDFYLDQKGLCALVKSHLMEIDEMGSIGIHGCKSNNLTEADKKDALEVHLEVRFFGQSSFKQNLPSQIIVIDMRAKRLVPDRVIPQSFYTDALPYTSDQKLFQTDFENKILALARVPINFKN